MHDPRGKKSAYTAEALPAANSDTRNNKGKVKGWRENEELEKRVESRGLSEQ